MASTGQAQPSTRASAASAEASSSRVTLDELRAKRVAEGEETMRLIKEAHYNELRELEFLIAHRTLLEEAGSPAHPPILATLPEPNEATLAFLQEWQLTSEAKGIANLALPPGPVPPQTAGLTLGAARPSRLRTNSSALVSAGEAATTPKAATPKKAAAPSSPAKAATASSTTPSINKRPMLPPPSVTKPTRSSALAAQQEASASAAASTSTSATAGASSSAASIYAVPEIPPRTVTRTAAQMVLAAAAERAKQPPPIPKRKRAPSSTMVNTEGFPVLRRGAKEATLSPETQQADDIYRVTERVTLHHMNPIDDTTLPVLHPTLQKLAPNPVAVTYASSLRPLPPDPFRRFTGAGVAGGAIHHRGTRKAVQLPPPRPGVPAPAGPAGAGSADLWRWSVRARASPGAGLVGKADKCLMTTDWRAAFAEQRFVRAMGRIEKLKSKGEWSFRQPKKQKGPVVRKAHWDYVLEEMKWMQTDFREERRWKTAIAFQLAHAAREWHRAKTPAARAALCVKTRIPDPIEAGSGAAGNEDEEMQAVKSEPVDADMAEAAAEEEARVISAAVAEATATAEVDADADADGEADADAEGEEYDADADAEADDVDRSLALLDAAPPSQPPVQVVREPLANPGPTPAFTTTSGNEAQQPGRPGEAPADASAEALARGVRTDAQGGEATLADTLPQTLITLARAPIFSMDITATTVTTAQLRAALDAEAASSMLGIEADQVPSVLGDEQLSLSALFPELPLYDAPLELEAGKSDRRWDDGSLNAPPRLTHVTRLLDSKPLLVSTLQPAKNRAIGRWRDDGDWILAAQMADPTKGVSQDILEAPPAPGSLLFTRKSNKPSRETPHASTTPAAPAQPDVRAAYFIWTHEEDEYLATLVRQYGTHWGLVADLFNSTRLTVPTDRREPWDCYDRYTRIQKAAEEGKPPPGPPVIPSVVEAAAAAAAAAGAAAGSPNGADAAQTAAALAMASNSLAAKRERLTKKLGQKYDGSRKKMRHNNIVEVMRKCAKKRDAAAAKPGAAQAARKVNLSSHETHTQIKPGPTMTPQQLSTLKAERDETSLRQYYAYQQQQQQQQREAQARQALAQQAAVISAQGGNAPGAPSARPLARPPAGMPPGAQAGPQPQRVQMQQGARPQSPLPRPPTATGLGVTLPPQLGMPGQPAQRMAAPGSNAAVGGQMYRPGTPVSGPPGSQAQFASAQPAGVRSPALGRASGSSSPAPSQAQQNAAAAMTQQAGQQGNIPLPLQALQASLTQSLASSSPNITPEQIQSLAAQLWRTTQAQQQQQQQQGGATSLQQAQAQVQQAQQAQQQAQQAQQQQQQQQGQRRGSAAQGAPQRPSPRPGRGRPPQQQQQQQARPPPPQPNFQQQGGARPPPAR